MTLIQHHTLIHYLLLLTSCNFFVWAYPQQTVTTAVLATVALDFGSVDSSISGSEEDFTTIALVGISSGTDSNGNSVSETTYSRELVVSDAAFTTTTNGEVVVDTLVPGVVMTEIDTIVENASGYYISGSQYFTGGTLSVTVQGEYLTCSFTNPEATVGGCSESDILPEATTTLHHSDGYSANIIPTTITQPVQALVSSSTAAVSASSKPSNGGVLSQKQKGLVSMMYLVPIVLVSWVM